MRFPVAIVFRDTPDKPFGTHVPAAMAAPNAGLRWTAVTIDDGDDAEGHRARPHRHPTQDVLDRMAPTACIAAILDHRLASR